MDYAEKLATTAAEISYLSGNVVASDAICERIDHACRLRNKIIYFLLKSLINCDIYI